MKKASARHLVEPSENALTILLVKIVVVCYNYFIVITCEPEKEVTKLSKWNKRLEADCRTIYFLTNDEMSCVYVGQTKRSLNSRFNEHKNGYCEYTKDLINPLIIEIESQIVTE